MNDALRLLNPSRVRNDVLQVNQIHNITPWALGIPKSICCNVHYYIGR